MSTIVTELDMMQLADVPSQTSLLYDVYAEDDDTYSVYVVAKYVPYSFGKTSHTVFRHDIKSSGNNRSFVKASLKLNDDICVDQIKVASKLIILTCLSSREVVFIDREKLKVLNSAVSDDRITLLGSAAGEVFSPVSNVGGDKFNFASDYIKLLDREGHLQIFISTYEEASGFYKLHTYEIIMDDNSGSNEALIY